MKNLTLLFILVISAFLSYGQQTQILWLDESYNSVPESMATCKMEVTTVDSIETMHVTHFKTLYEIYEYYKNGKPFGKWQEIFDGNVIGERDFDNIIYQTENFNSDIKPIKTKRKDRLKNKIPSYPGGDKARYEYLHNAIEYPPIARERGIEGTSLISFIITSEGKIESIVVSGSSNPYLDYEAVRVVSLMPTWNPGLEDGKPVRVQITMPVRFALPGGNLVY